MTRIAPPLVTTTKHLVDLLHTIQSLPCDERGFVKLDEDSFTMNLVGGYPIRFAARQAGHLRTLIGGASFFGRFDPSEAQQGIHLAQALKEQDSTDMAAESRWCTDLLAHEVRVVRRRVGLCQHIPLGSFDVELTHDILPAAGAMCLNTRPDHGCIVLIDSRQRPGLLQGLHCHRHFGYGIEIFEKLPAILDQLTERK